MIDLRESTREELSQDVSKLRFPIEYKKLREGFRVPEKEGNCYYLFTAEEVVERPGEKMKIPLGFSCRLPVGYSAEMHLTEEAFNKYGLMHGMMFPKEVYISWEYSKNDDEWFITARCVHLANGNPEVIPAGTKLGYFKLGRTDFTEKLVSLEFVEVNSLEDNDEAKFLSRL